MIDIYMMQYNFWSKYLVVINGNIYVSVNKYEKYKFDQQFLFFQAKKVFNVNQKFAQRLNFREL